jgi:hypothetical protein
VLHTVLPDERADAVIQYSKAQHKEFRGEERKGEKEQYKSSIVLRIIEFSSAKHGRAVIQSRARNCTAY